MVKENKISRAGLFLVTAACFVIVIAGMKTASAILVPFLLSLFIAIICAPPLFWLQKKGIPGVLAVLIILIIIVAVGSLLAVFIGTSVADFTEKLPFYQKLLSGKTAVLIEWLEKTGFRIPRNMLGDLFDPGKVMKVVGNALSGLSGVLTNLFMIILTVIFILLEASGFSGKLRTGLQDPDGSLHSLTRFTEGINRYMALKTLFSLVTGLAIWIWLAILGVDYALLWGLTAFLLNFVPNIGSIIAAIPALLLTLIQLGVTSTLLAALGYVLVNVLVGSILEPRFMGRGLGLSTLIVFLSLVFWGWVLGPVGMILSVPLTMIVKIAMENHEETRWVAVLLGPGTKPDTQKRPRHERGEDLQEGKRNNPGNQNSV